MITTPEKNMTLFLSEVSSSLLPWSADELGTTHMCVFCTAANPELNKTHNVKYN